MQKFFLLLALSLTGCVGLSPELIEALSKDNASFCATGDIRGGVGSIVAPSGGYGQSTHAICRTNHPGAKLKLMPDGSIEIEHK